VGLIGGNPLHLADGGFRNRWDPDFAATWHEVRDPVGAIHYFHFRGTVLFQELHREARPKGIADLVAAQIVECENVAALNTWRMRSLEEVECDPRFIAHRCAFSRDMAQRTTGNPSEWSLPGTEALGNVGEVNVEEFLAFFGETMEDYGGPN
jgi:hypothetical protein